MNQSVDRVFKALGDSNRRRIIEIISESPGISIQDLCNHFPTSRFAVMKHINILEEAGLLRRERDGTSKLLFLCVDYLCSQVNGWLHQFDSQN